MGLDVEDKPFFHHLANRPENYGREIHPTPDEYLANGMMPGKRRQFDEWYAAHRQEPFRLDEALASYCTNDISRRQEYIDGIDDKRKPRRHRRTARVHDHRRSVYGGISALIICPLNIWPSSLSAEHGVEVQTAHSAGGEKRIGPYSLDGWIEAEGRAIEVNGCTWHGCKKCYPNDNLLLHNGKTAGQVRERDAKRMEYLRARVNRVDVYWECKITSRLERSKAMRKSFATYVDDGPLWGGQARRTTLSALALLQSLGSAAPRKSMVAVLACEDVDDQTVLSVVHHLMPKNTRVEGCARMTVVNTP
ncbi:hypothetical protein niasHT_038662 [Heterodera trifolii]|uniref:DNA-directed DNA polymerase n=1 Tax=Heterodera trifolii TaxID=157864 RepID=A0ABD2IYA0_9BILA